jgi:hypothetical protein
MTRLMNYLNSLSTAADRQAARRRQQQARQRGFWAGVSYRDLPSDLSPDTCPPWLRTFVDTGSPPWKQGKNRRAGK